MPKNKKALEARIAELEQQLAEATKGRSQTSNRKYEVLALLKQGPMSTSELAIALNTTKNNIGSLLSYLRNTEGRHGNEQWVIHRNHMQQHYLPDGADQSAIIIQ